MAVKLRLSDAMVHALERATAGTLITASNHPSLRVLRKAGYLVQGEEAGKRVMVRLWR
jgi:hypothetical protein